MEKNGLYDNLIRKVAKRIFDDRVKNKENNAYDEKENWELAKEELREIGFEIGFEIE